MSFYGRVNAIMAEPIPSLGETLRRFREDLHLTQAQVAAAAETDQSRISEVERDEYLPGFDLLARIVTKGLKLSLTDVMAAYEGRPIADQEPGQGRSRGAIGDIGGDVAARLFKQQETIARQAMLAVLVDVLTALGKVLAPMYADRERA
jgi:transcriptional regulator with XRE-family HTH domain